MIGTPEAAVLVVLLVLGVVLYWALDRAVRAWRARRYTTTENLQHYQRLEHNQGVEQTCWRTPKGTGSLWDISRDEDRRRRNRQDRALRVVGRGR